MKVYQVQIKKVDGSVFNLGVYAQEKLAMLIANSLFCSGYLSEGDKSLVSEVIVFSQENPFPLKNITKRKNKAVSKLGKGLPESTPVLN